MNATNAFLLGMIFQATVGAFLVGFVDALIEEITGFSYQKYMRQKIQP